MNWFALIKMLFSISLEVRKCASDAKKLKFNFSKLKCKMQKKDFFKLKTII
jgi:hypothetical protein